MDFVVLGDSSVVFIDFTSSKPRSTVFGCILPQVCSRNILS